MKILVCILCSTERAGWLNPALCSSLLMLQCDPRFSVTVEMVSDVRPVEHARNLCVWKARQAGAAACVQIDNDMMLPSCFGDILCEALTTGKHVVSLKCGGFLPEGPTLLPDDSGPKDGNFQETGFAGGGVLIIGAQVWRVIERGPWFRWLLEDDEVLSRKLGEDYYFCELVQSRGFKVWTHQRMAGHLKTTDATRVVLAMRERRRI